MFFILSQSTCWEIFQERSEVGLAWWCNFKRKHEGSLEIASSAGNNIIFLGWMYFLSQEILWACFQSLHSFPWTKTIKIFTRNFFVAEPYNAACRSLCWWFDRSRARATSVRPSRTTQGKGGAKTSLFHKRPEKGWLSLVTEHIEDKHELPQKWGW